MRTAGCASTRPGPPDESPLVSALVQHRGGSAVQSRGVPAMPAAALSSADLRFEVKAPTWADHSSSEAPSAGVVAETITKLDGLRRIGSALIEERHGFRAYRDRFVSVEFTRAVARGADGRYRPVGGWVANSAVHTGKAPSVWTHGVVPAGLLSEDGTASFSSAGDVPSRAAASALDAERYVPSQVLIPFVKAVPVPEIHIGAFLLFTDPSGRPEQRVVILRADALSAVVIRACRSDFSTASWTVDQWAYDLGGSARALRR